MRGLLVILLLVCGTVSAEHQCGIFVLQPDGSLRCDENPNKLRDQILADSFMALGAVLDCHSTRLAIRTGAGYELNPIMRPFVHSFAACIAFKSAFVIPAAVIGWKADKVRIAITVGAVWNGIAVANYIAW